MSSLFKRIILILICSFLFFSCNEDEFLKEVPLDFYSPENSYVTYNDFVAAIYNLHYLTREAFWEDTNPQIWWRGTDMVQSMYDVDNSLSYSIEWGPMGGYNLYLWKISYRIIYDANVIIGRSDSEFSKLTEEEKILVKAEARFFRGYFYKCLADLFGGVPLVLEEIKSPKRDYVRATREEVYDQCAQDLKFAADNLPDIDDVDESRINKLAASHILAEVYISSGDYNNAIIEASKIINHPNVALMTSRFGANKEKLFNDPNFVGDLYWDLFRNGNQDRFAGNTESIWVIQFKYNEGDRDGILGGGGRLSYSLGRQVAPDLTKANIRQTNGKTSPVLKQANTYYNQRGQGFNKPSPYFLYKIWSAGDLRNSSCNIIRDYPVLNPDNQYNGKWVKADNLPLVVSKSTDTTRFFYPTIGKIISPGMDPPEYIDTNPDVPAGSLLYDARRTWRKHYQIRLAETYLLRAEAYLGAGQTSNACNDINVVRRRANAPDATPDQITIDYILDERLRELYYEELRVMTLGRLGKIVDRTSRFDPIVSRTIGAHQNLWAIPKSEIIKNVEAVLEQNPGY